MIGIANFFLRRFDEAAIKMLLAVEQTPAWPWPYRGLAACYAHIGRLADARKIVSQLRTISPVVVPKVTPFRNPEHRELFLSGLRLAAGEAR